MRQVRIPLRNALPQFVEWHVQHAEDDAGAQRPSMLSVYAPFLPRPQSPVQYDIATQFQCAGCDSPLQVLNTVAACVEFAGPATYATTISPPLAVAMRASTRPAVQSMKRKGRLCGPSHSRISLADPLMVRPEKAIGADVCPTRWYFCSQRRMRSSQLWNSVAIGVEDSCNVGGDVQSIPHRRAALGDGGRLIRHLDGGSRPESLQDAAAGFCQNVNSPGMAL